MVLRHPNYRCDLAGVRAMKSAYRLGARAREAKREKSTCPFKRMSCDWSWWMAGWNDFQYKGAARVGVNLSDEEILQMCQLYEHGFGLVWISEAYGVSPITVRDRLNRQAVKMRSRGRRGKAESIAP